MNVLRMIATGRNVLMLLVLFLLFNFVIIPAIYPKFQTLDTLSSYTPSEAYRHISSYGDQGRQLYLIMELSLDLVYPVVSALFFSCLILYTFQRAFPAQPWTQWFALIPFAVMLTDYLENATIVTMLLNYPRQLLSAARIANMLTVIKFDLSWLELIFVIGLAGWLVRALRTRVSSPRPAS